MPVRFAASRFALPPCWRNARELFSGVLHVPENVFHRICIPVSRMRRKPPGWSNDGGLKSFPRSANGKSFRPSRRAVLTVINLPGCCLFQRKTGLLSYVRSVCNSVVACPRNGIFLRQNGNQRRWLAKCGAGRGNVCNSCFGFQKSWITVCIKNPAYCRALSVMRAEIRYYSVLVISLVRLYGPVPIAARRFAVRKKLPMHKKSSVVPARSFRSAASILPCALFAAGHRAKLRHQAPVSKNIMRFLCQLEAMTPKTILFFCAMSAIQHGTKPIRKYRVS